MKNILFITIFLITLSINFSQITEIPLDEGVLVLKESNFDIARKRFDYLLVEFYAPWCGHCKTLAPEYAKAAQKLLQEDSSVHLAKVDATTEPALSDRFSITGYPSIKLFTSTNPDTVIEYNGGRTADEIMEWLKRRTGPVSIEIFEINDLEKFISDNDIVVVYFGGSNQNKYKSYVSIASEFDDVTFLHTNQPKILEKYDIKHEGKVLIFKNFDDGKIELHDTWTEFELRQFIKNNQFPVLIKFDDKGAQKIFTDELNVLFLIKNDDELGQKAEKALKNVADSIKDKITISVANIQDLMGARLAEFLEIAEEQLPLLRILDTRQKKFVFDGAITSENIVKFVQDFTKNLLKPHFKSEDIPEENNGPVKIVVGKTFKDIVLNENNDVLVEFYAPWCGHCKNLAPIYENVAKRMAYIKNLVIAKIDATANDVEGIEIESFPIIIFYQKGNKQNPIHFDGDRDEDAIIDFLKKHAISEQGENVKSKKTSDDL